MVRVKSQPAVKTPSQPGGGMSISETQSWCAQTGQETVPAGVQGPQEQEKKMKKQYRQPLLFRIGAGTELVILFAPFARLVREVTEFYSREVTRWTPEAVLLLQYAAEFVLMDEMRKTENPLTINLERVAIKQEQEELSRARSGGTHHDLAQHIVDNEPAATVTPATTRRRRGVDTPIQVKEEPSRRRRENSVSMGRNVVAMEASAAASTTTAKRRRRRNVEAPAEGPGIRQRAKRARQPCSRYSASDSLL